MTKHNISAVRTRHPSGGITVQVKVLKDRHLSHVALYGLDCPDNDTVQLFLGLDMGGAAHGIHYYVVTMDNRDDTVTRITSNLLPLAIKRCPQHNLTFDVSWQPGHAEETACVEEAVFA